MLNKGRFLGGIWSPEALLAQVILAEKAARYANAFSEKRFAGPVLEMSAPVGDVAEHESAPFHELAETRIAKAA